MEKLMARLDRALTKDAPMTPAELSVLEKEATTLCDNITQTDPATAKSLQNPLSEAIRKIDALTARLAQSTKPR